MESESKTRTLLQLLFSSSILKCLFRGSRRQLYQKCSNTCNKNDTLLEATPKMTNCVSTAPARADRGSDPLENDTKSKENETFEPRRQKVQQKGALWDIFATILMAKSPQARDKTGLRSHSAPDSRKHVFLRGQGAKHCKTRVLGRSRSEPGGEGAALLGCWENNDLAP